MSVKHTLDLAVAQRNLLEHPFYQAWNQGTLPVEALQLYAREYGAFIRMLPDAWRSLDDLDTEREEHEHAELWKAFATGLGTQLNWDASLPEVRALTALAARLFADPVTAAGALYAFEVQQPATAASKLTGLRQHYHLPVEVEPYFEIHSHNEHEARKLASRIDFSRPAEQVRAAEACAEMADALWNALSGIHGSDRMGSGVLIGS
jgi:pyrroloquinoline-quinone synthase